MFAVAVFVHAFNWQMEYHVTKAIRSSFGKMKADVCF